jgi:hypothetical protein
MKKEKQGCVRLSVCNLNECEARCCYDGVYLEPGEEIKIRELVDAAPEFFKSLPPEFIVDGGWEGRVSGRKTAVQPHKFLAPDFPEHFSHTRCVFNSEQHKCMLQLLAVDQGVHRWAYKPRSCWMFPMHALDGALTPPPTHDEPDPNCLGEAYPGYVKFVPCGQDRGDGEPWQDTLAEEIAHWSAEEAKRSR